MIQQHPNGVVEWGDGLYALSNPIPLDGRPVSTHPRQARGHAPINAFLIVGPEGGLMIDTGVRLHEAALLSQLESVLPAGKPVSIMILRPSEFNSVSNAKAIAENFPMGELIMGGGFRPEDFPGWLDFTGEWGVRTGQGALEKAAGRSPMGKSTLSVLGGRELHLVRPQLQLISTYWVWDEAGHTMFTSDAFSHRWRESPEGPWLVDSLGDLPTVEEMVDFLTGSRYWWLAGADTAPIRAWLRELLSTHEIETIAPVSGCVISGKDVVAEHFDLMDKALEVLGQMKPPTANDLIPYYQETV